MKRIILALACVGLAGGVASADRFHGSRGGNTVHTGGSRGPVVRDHRGGGEWHGAREGGVRVTEGARWNNRPVYNRGGYYNSGYRYNNYVRRPIYVGRPVIRERYYDYRYRPNLIVENYPARDGYFWVAGQWTWDGYEWQWQPGHYEPDPSYGVSAGVYIGG
jgi:hypothetical protein